MSFCAEFCLVLNFYFLCEGDVYMLVLTSVEARGRQWVSCSVIFYFIPWRQGLLVNLELGWQHSSPSGASCLLS